MSCKNTAELDVQGLVIPDEAVEGLVRELLVPFMVDQYIRSVSDRAESPKSRTRQAERSSTPKRALGARRLKPQ